MKKKIRVSKDCACAKFKKAAELAEKEKIRLDEVIDAIGDGISIQDTNFRVLYQNKAHMGFMGDHKGEFCYRAYEHRSHVCVGCPVAMSFKDGKVHTVERSAPGKNGARYFEITSSPLKDASGKIVSGIESAREITWRKSIDSKLSESETRLKDAQKIAHIGNWSWNLKTNELYWSDENYRIFGIARDVKPSVVEFMRYVHPDDKESVSKSIDDALHKRKPYDIDMRIIKPDKTERIVTSRAVVTFDKSGKPEKMTGTVQDVTERKIAENDLQESEEKYRTMIEASMDLMWLLDTEGKYTYFNKRAEELAGCSLKDMIGKSFKQFIEKGELAKVIDVFRKTLQGKPQKYEVFTKGKDGRRFLLSVNTAPTYSGGKITGTVSFAEDITIQRKSDNELKNTKQMLENIAHGITDSVFLLSIDRRILWANAAASQFAGRKNKDIVGMHCYEVAHNRKSPCALPDLPCAMAECLKTGEPATTIHKYCDSKGNVRYAEVSIYPVKNNAGKIIQFVHTIRDITERKKAEEEYKTILQTAMDSFYVIDEHGRILEVNDSYCNLIGYSRSELLKMKISDVDIIDNAEVVSRRMNQIMKTGSARFETRHKRKDGGIIAIEASVNYSNIGEKRFFAFMRDITERNKLLDDLTKFRLGFERSGDAIFITDERGTITYVNHSFENIYGYTKDEALGKTPRIIKSGLIPKEQYEQFWGTLLAKRIVAGEIINKRKDGELVTIEGSNNPIIDESGKIIGFLSIHHDITKRKKTEENIQLLSRQNELILSSAAEGIIGLDTEGKMTFVNPAAARMLGYEANELIGKPGHKTWHHSKADGKPYPQSECPIYAAYKDGKLHRSLDDVFWNKNGESFSVEYTSIPIWENGKLSGAVVTFTDITDRKKSYEDIRKLNAELRAKINDLERFNQLTVGRELKMVELKKRINELEGKIRGGQN